MPVKEYTDEEIDALEPTYIGPTWQCKNDGSWKLPKHTLGWQILGWCGEYLNNFDGSPNLRLTPEQARFILWWYAIDEDGEFVYNTGVLQRLKGWGKDPITSVISTVEFVGPCRFGGWDENGAPIAIPHSNSWVQIAAVSRDQTRNTMTLFPVILSAKIIATYGIKMGAELIRANSGKSRLEAVTSSFRALEGGRATFTLCNETQHWVRGNNGDKMIETIDGNATKMKSRYLAITNAPLPGEDSVAERTRESFDKTLSGRAQGYGLLYDSIEAHPETPLTAQALRIVIPKIRGDAKWLSVDSIIKSMLNGLISPSRTRRMYLNQIVADEDALYSRAQWEPLRRDGAKLAPGDQVVLGFDGGKTDDATALVALRLSDKTAFVLGMWQRPHNWPTGEDAPKWEVSRELVDSAVHDAFRVLKPVAFYADVALWESYIAEWSRQYGDTLRVQASGTSAIGWDMRSSLQRVTRAHERLVQDILDKKLFHDGDPDLQTHVLNARRRVNAYGVSFGKESRESPRKVDLYAALMLAHEAMFDFYAKAKPEKPAHDTRGWFI